MIFDDDFFEPSIPFGESTAPSDNRAIAAQQLLRIRTATAALAVSALLAINVSATELDIRSDVLSAKSQSSTRTSDRCAEEIFELANVPHDAKTRSSHWLRSTRQDSYSAEWVDPHVTASPEHEVVFEWWQGERKLTAFFSEDAALLLRAWGEDIDTEMDESNPEEKGVFAEAWQWLRA
jgi:hypothetical protein